MENTLNLFKPSEVEDRRKLIEALEAIEKRDRDMKEIVIPNLRNLLKSAIENPKNHPIVFEQKGRIEAILAKHGGGEASSDET